MKKGWEILLQTDYPTGSRPIANSQHPLLPLVALAYDDATVEVCPPPNSFHHGRGRRGKGREGETREDSTKRSTGREQVWNVERRSMSTALGPEFWSSAMPDKKSVTIHALAFYDTSVVNHKHLSSVCHSPALCSARPHSWSLMCCCGLIV